MPLAVAREQFTGGIEVGVLANAGEDIENLTSVRRCVARAVGCEQGKAMRSGEGEESVYDVIFATNVVTLQFDEQVARAEDRFELLEARFGLGIRVALQCASERPFFVASERDETGGEFGQFFPAHFALAFSRAQMRPGQQTAKILVTGTTTDQERQ